MPKSFLAACILVASIATVVFFWSLGQSSGLDYVLVPLLLLYIASLLVSAAWLLRNWTTGRMRAAGPMLILIVGLPLSVLAKSVAWNMNDSSFRSNIPLFESTLGDLAARGGLPDGRIPSALLPEEATRCCAAVFAKLDSARVQSVTFLVNRDLAYIYNPRDSISSAPSDWIHAERISTNWFRVER